MQYAPYTDIPAWLGVLSCIAGLAITIAMGKYVARREAKKREMQAKIIFEAEPAGGKVHEEVLVRTN
jgi:hypothetical protein